MSNSVSGIITGALASVRIKSALEFTLQQIVSGNLIMPYVFIIREI